MSYQLRPVGGEEFERFARVGVLTFGEDWSSELLEYERRFVELDRTLAAFDGGDMVATAGAYTFDLTLPGLTTVPAAGVTWVTVLPTHRRRGILRQMMTRQLDDVAERGEPVAVLNASEATIYGRFGYGIGTQAAVVELRKENIQLASPSRAGGRIRLLDPDEARKVVPGIYETYRRNQPGAITCNERWWESYFTDPEKFHDGASSRYYAVHESEAGEADGYAAYRMSWGSWAPDRPGATLKLLRLHTADPEVEAALFEYLLGVDLIWQLELAMRPTDDQLRWRLADFRRYRTMRIVDSLWVRLLDIPAALAARRYATDDAMTIAVHDNFRPANDGVYRIESGPDGAFCERLDDGADADLALGVDVLGAAYLGEASLATAAAAGRAAGSPSALARADAMFRSWPRAFCDREF